ncbi:MAG: hypothetical protein AAFW87_09670, partial [Pseudomonadota bacterium]
MKRIAGINAPRKGGMAVLKPFDIQKHVPDGYIFTRWVASLPWWTPFAVLALMAVWPQIVYAQGRYSTAEAFNALWRWMPFLIQSGFFFNVLISLLAMAIGTVAGAALGLGQISLHRPIRGFAWFITQLFRNSPWLVILFILISNGKANSTMNKITSH